MDMCDVCGVKVPNGIGGAGIGGERWCEACYPGDEINIPQESKTTDSNDIILRIEHPLLSIYCGRKPPVFR